MLAGYFHQGSGLGNQLFRYVTVRTVAKKLEVPFGMIYNPDGSGKPEGFKGMEFMDIDYGSLVEGMEIPEMKLWTEKKVVENGVDIRGYDPEINFVTDNTLIEGEFQDERYWDIEDVKRWLKHDSLAVPDDMCIIGFRGGEYMGYPDLLLPPAWWENCIRIMRSQNPDMKFHVVTDDPLNAQMFFPDFEVTHDIKYDWLKIRHAKYAIIANSSFYILPRLMNEKPGITLAPRYWARHNTGVWALPSNFYSKFHYV